MKIRISGTGRAARTVQPGAGRRRMLASVASVGLVALIVSACGSSSGAPARIASAARASEAQGHVALAKGHVALAKGHVALTTLNVGDVPFYANAALALGEKVGIFAHYGLSVNLQTASNVNVILADLHSGQQQLGFASTPLVLNADEKGQAVKCVAPLGPANVANPSFPENAVVVAKNSKITSLKQLDGQTVGLNQLAGSNQLYLQVGVSQAHGSFSSLKLATVPFADMAAALASGTIQAAFEVPPFISTGVAAGQTRVLADLDNVTSPWTTECYVATDSYITSNRSVINRFVEAQDQSILYANAHPKQAVAEIPTVSGLSSAAAAASVPPTIVWTDLLGPSSLINYQDLMIRYKALEGSALSVGVIAYTAPGTPMPTLLFGNGGKYTGGKTGKK